MNLISEIVATTNQLHVQKKFSSIVSFCVYDLYESSPYIAEILYINIEYHRSISRSKKNNI